MGELVLTVVSCTYEGGNLCNQGLIAVKIHFCE